MADDPFRPVERKLGPNEFSFRREIVPNTTPRGSSPARATTLPSIFQDAHPWPLQWGGPEVWEGRFFAHGEFNGSAQKVMENAGVRLAKTASENGVRIRCTVAVTSYPEQQLHLLERATYKFEAVIETTDGYKISPLGELTIGQSLSKEQRVALVRGTRLTADPKAPIQRYHLDGKVIEINPKTLVVVSANDAFAALDTRLADFTEGLRREKPHSKSPRTKEAERAEKAAIKEADREAKQRTAAPPIKQSELKHDKATGPTARATDTRAVEAGRPDPNQRATAATSKPIKTAEAPTTVDVKDRLQAAPKTPPTTEQVKSLESALSKGETEVRSAGARQVTVRVRESTGARGVIKAGLKASKFAPGVTALLHLIDERIPVLDPNTLMQKWVERRIGAGVERAIRWLDANFPPPGVFAPENSTLRARSEAATGELVAKGNVWRAQIKPGSQYGFQAHEDAEKSIAKNLDAVDRYSRHLADRVSKLAVKRDELHPITNNVEPYISALDTLANELEHKVELAAAMPGGYYMALELFSLAQFVRGVSKLVGQITTFIDQKDRDYRQAIDTAHKTLDQLERVEDEWSQVLMSAQQAAGL